MNSLVKMGSNVQQTMSSREIAQLCDKEHRNVMADIRSMLESLKIQSAEFLADYKDERGRTYPCFNLPKRETLILVSGYNIELRAKIIDRWQELEAATATPPPKQIRQSYNLGSVSRQCVIMAKAMGLKGNQAIISADRAVKKLTGESPLELLGETHLHAPVQEQSFTPSQIGELLNQPLKAHKVNLLLVEMGYQNKEGGVWVAMPAGEPFAELVDTTKRHTVGTPIKQLRWYRSVVKQINEYLSTLVGGTLL